MKKHIRTSTASAAVAAIALLTSACASTAATSGDEAKTDNGGQPKPKSETIVLVHGAFADHHAFDAVAPLLEQRGYRVIAPDLPGHGDDATPATGLSLQSYVDTITKVVDAQPGDGGVVLVGHSMAGMVVSQVAERSTQRVKKLVFVAAYLPQNGESLQKLAETDTDSLVGSNMQLSPDYATVTIKPEKIVEAICADVSPEIQKIVIASQKPEPLKPFQGTVDLTPARFGRVPKAYLSTSEDRAVTPALQTRMIAGYPEIRTASIATSHLPFVARPGEFTEKLVALIAQE